MRKGALVPSPGFERLPGKAMPGEEKLLAHRVKCEMRRLKVSDGSLCPDHEQEKKKKAA